MSKRRSIRHCPVCGIAMQGKKTRPEVEHFDLFECLTCQTTITVTRPGTEKHKKAHEQS